MPDKPIVTVDGVSVTFTDYITGEVTKVIDHTSFDLYPGEVFGIIGESGSGKTVITSLLNGFLGSGGAITEGAIIINGKDVTNYTQRQWVKSKLRGNVVGRVFQNPTSALNPSLKIGYQLIDSLLENKIYKRQEDAEKAVKTLLEQVRIPDPSYVWNKYPHELSGGMIQRVVLTMVLAMEPEIVILDEPTTALDPIVQFEILTIIRDLVKKLNIAFVFISHDIGVIANIADRIGVMYAGRIIEYGDKREILYNPQHPYTWGLLSSLPSSAIDGVMTGIPGVFNSSMMQPDTDAFAWRNQYALAIDFQQRPPMFKVNDAHYAATWLLDPRAPKVKKPPFVEELTKLHPLHAAVKPKPKARVKKGDHEKTQQTSK